MIIKQISNTNVAPEGIYRRLPRRLKKTRLEQFVGNKRTGYRKKTENELAREELEYIQRIGRTVRSGKHVVVHELVSGQTTIHLAD